MLAGQSIGSGENVIGAKAEVDRAYLLEAAQQQSGSSEQHQRHRQFRDHENRTQARMTSAGAAGSAAFFQRVVDAGMRGGNGRNDSAHQPGENRQKERKTCDLPVKSNGANARQSSPAASSLQREALLPR